MKAEGWRPSGWRRRSQGAGRAMVALPTAKGPHRSVSGEMEVLRPELLDEVGALQPVHHRSLHLSQVQLHPGVAQLPDKAFQRVQGA